MLEIISKVLGTTSVETIECLEVVGAWFLGAAKWLGIAAISCAVIGFILLVIANYCSKHNIKLPIA